MALRTDVLDLARLQLTSGEGRRLDLHVRLAPFAFGNQSYDVEPQQIPVRVDLSRTTAAGYALRLRFSAGLSGPCMRCLGPAAPVFVVDAREVHQPGGGEELSSPYVVEEALELGQWARDALALALPAQIACTPECRGLCPQCGANLNDDPEHAHERAPDPRWAKLSDVKFE